MKKTALKLLKGVSAATAASNNETHIRPALAKKITGRGDGPTEQEKTALDIASAK